MVQSFRGFRAIRSNVSPGISPFPPIGTYGFGIGGGNQKTICILSWLLVLVRVAAVPNESALARIGAAIGAGMQVRFS